jgi:ABC-type uncharacterized transport system involved in gliding motility auxiliary subunit
MVEHPRQFLGRIGFARQPQPIDRVGNPDASVIDLASLGIWLPLARPRRPQKRDGSIRSSASARIAAGFTAGISSVPVSAASAIPRSGSGVSFKYSPISRSFELRERV